jgi:hypothetical protein
VPVSPLEKYSDEQCALLTAWLALAGASPLLPEERLPLEHFPALSALARASGTRGRLVRAPRGYRAPSNSKTQRKVRVTLGKVGALA